MILDNSRKFSKLSRLSKFSRLSLLSLLSSCTIEPPLQLIQEAVEIRLPLVVNELEVVWNIDVDWAKWWYGWDEEDERRWGRLEYPDPTYFEVRCFYQGEEHSDVHRLEESFTLYGNRFKRRYKFGYHDLLLWSNIDSPDGTQTVLINESDPDNVIATTTQGATSYTRGAYADSRTREVELKTQPDIFYCGYEHDLYISRNTEDYDHYDEEEKAWVKKVRTSLSPVVYIYLVQVLLYNNDGRVIGLADNATLTGMSEGVNLNTGHTLMREADVVFDMRMKKDMPGPQMRRIDILGSMFTTFGLCDMGPWFASRGPQYAGSRTDLSNSVLLDLQFNNSTDALFTYDVTSQMRSQTHGGVVTIEIDADTITIPSAEAPSGSGFRPWVSDMDSVVHEFGI